MIWIAMIGWWLYLGICVALDGLGGAWWHWPYVLLTVAGGCVILAREELQTRRMRRSWMANAPRVLGESESPVQWFNRTWE
jgi:hypothetical protein